MRDFILILSNLLDIVKERADAAERELERVAASFSVASDGSGRSARVISTCSDVSVRSDEVFDGASPVYLLVYHLFCLAVQNLR